MNVDNLKGIVPDHVLEQLPSILSPFNITTALRLAHFLAQCSHESLNFSVTRENLNYSGERLREVFKRHFVGVSVAGYAHNPEQIGARVYANRMGNGNEKTGDGYRYRGRGYIQLTGKDNYALFMRFIGEDVLANPDLVATKYPLASAAFYFDSNRLWKWCDVGHSEQAVANVTKRVNSGLLGLAERTALFNKIYAALSL